MSVTTMYIPEDCGPTIYRHFETLGNLSDGVEIPEPMLNTLNEATLDLELVLAIPGEAGEIGLQRAEVLARYVAAYNAALEFCIANR